MYLKYLSARKWEMVLILQNTSGFSCFDKMLWVWRRKTAHMRTKALSVCSILAALMLNTTKSMMPGLPLSLTKQQSQSIVPDPSVTNSYIHIDTPGNKTSKERGIEGQAERWRDIFLLFCFVGGALVIRPPLAFTAANCFATSFPSSLSCQICPWCIIITTLGGNP